MVSEIFLPNIIKIC